MRRAADATWSSGHNEAVLTSMLLLSANLSVSTCRARRVAPRRVAARAVHASSSSQHAKVTGAKATQPLALPRRELLTSLGAVATLVLGALAARHSLAVVVGYRGPGHPTGQVDAGSLEAGGSIGAT